MPRTLLVIIIRDVPLRQTRLPLAVLREDELHRGGVHAVAERGDAAEVGNAEESVELVLLDRMVTANEVSFA